MLPHISKRCRPLAYCCLGLLALLLFQRFSLFETSDLVPLLPAHLSTSPSYPLAVLRPGDFVDSGRIRPIPEDEDEPLLDGPNGLTISHDKRNYNFYLGGTSSLTTQAHSDLRDPVVYDPYPAYNTEPWRKLWVGEFRACEGPRGTNLDRSDPHDMISVYRGNQKDFPFPIFGSHEVLDLDANVCMDRCSRLGAYGYDEGNYTAGCYEPAKLAWDQVNWGALQSQCADKNARRYADRHLVPQQTLPSLGTVLQLQEESTYSSSPGQQFHSRSAVIIRSWHNMTWTASHRQYLRSMIMELSLHSGAEYELFLLMDVKDTSIRISEDDVISRLKKEHIPPEFHNITIYFNTELLENWYPDVGEHRPVYQHLQPIQIFSQAYPHFEYYWQFEMDSRNIGHAYQFLERASDFGTRQPRKYLWERNAYFYTPGAHGSWEDFVQMVDQSMATRENVSVWGPVPVAGVRPSGPNPPTSNPSEDQYQWGVGEPADLLTMLPIFDVRETKWAFRNKTWNLPDIPRRASPITMWRMSRKLLNVMHQAQRQGQGVVSEMSAPTGALLHGLKAVYVPHPIFVDGQWTAKELARIFNPGQPEKINGGSDSVWNWDHLLDRALYRTSYMFTTQLAEDLYRRWLGFLPDQKQYSDGKLHKDPQGLYWYEGGSLDEKKYGRLCFPAMFLHTVKNTATVKGADMAVPV